MKKTNYIIAIAAVACIALVSCENKGNSSSESSSQSTDSIEQSDAQASEQTEEQKSEPAKEVAIKDQKELSCDNYTITVPEGWEAGSRMVNSSCNMRMKSKPYASASLNFSHDKIEKLTENIQKNGGKAVEDMTVNGKTFKVFFNEAQMRYDLLVPQGDGFVTMFMQKGGTTMEGDELKEAIETNLKALLENLTLK